MLRRYWPKSQPDQHVDVASRRSLAGFCVLAGSAGVAVTLVNMRFFADAPEAITVGGIASLMCLLAPIWVNANASFKFRARVVGFGVLALLTILAVMGRTLITPSNLLMIPGIMTFALAVGWRTGLSYLVATLSIYVWCVMQSSQVDTQSVTSYGLTLLAALGGMAIFVFVGATIFRSEMINAAERLERAKRSAEAATDHFRERAATDALTGAANRTSIDKLLSASVDRGRETGTPFSVVVFDLDHFKRVNDTYGHLAGDRVLIEVVRAVRSIIRPSDTLGRIGGEEFAVILDGVAGEAAVRLTERMREAIENVAIDVEGRGRVRPTASFGLADGHPDLTPNDLLEQADQCLYRAKRSGRNRLEYRTASDSQVASIATAMRA
jgi:diguanylate cyclase